MQPNVERRQPEVDFAELDAFLAQYRRGDSWSDDGCLIASAMFERLPSAGWTGLREALPERSSDWTFLCADALFAAVDPAGQHSRDAIRILFEIIERSDDAVTAVAAQSLTCATSGEVPLAVPDAVREKVRIVAARATPLQRVVLEALLARLA